MDVSILKDRIGLLLANVEMRRSKEELCTRSEAIEIAFQFCVYYWGDDYVQTDDTFLYIDSDKRLHLMNRENEEVLTSLTLGFSQSRDSIHSLKAYYKSNNQGVV
jgi:hypothetical protein